MPIFKEFALAGSAVLVFLLVSGAFFGDREGQSRLDASLYESTLYAPRLADAAELRFRDATPAGRVREVFDRFAFADDSRRGKHDASTTALIR